MANLGVDVPRPAGSEGVAKLERKGQEWAEGNLGGLSGKPDPTRGANRAEVLL